MINIFIKYKLLWITCGMILFLNALFYMSVVSDQKKTIAELQEKYSTTRKKVHPENRKGSPLYQYSEARQSWEEFISKLPAMTSVSVSIKELKQIISHSISDDLELSFKPEKIEPLELWKYSTELKIASSYETMRKLIADIQNSPSLFCIEDISIMQSENKEKVNLKLGISTYCRQ